MHADRLYRLTVAGLLTSTLGLVLFGLGLIGAPLPFLDAVPPGWHLALIAGGLAIPIGLHLLMLSAAAPTPRAPDAPREFPLPSTATPPVSRVVLPRKPMREIPVAVVVDPRACPHCASACALEDEFCRKCGLSLPHWVDALLRAP